MCKNRRRSILHSSFVKCTGRDVTLFISLRGSERGFSRRFFYRTCYITWQDIRLTKRRHDTPSKKKEKVQDKSISPCLANPCTMNQRIVVVFFFLSFALVAKALIEDVSIVDNRNCESELRVRIHGAGRGPSLAHARCAYITSCEEGAGSFKAIRCPELCNTAGTADLNMLFLLTAPTPVHL